MEREPKKRISTLPMRGRERILKITNDIFYYIY